ncbi:SpaA isopeptide-forming pilin-related protein [Paraclostridium bifermentans]|uniref:SpaA isopeptide-forming pilin-related protein n=1 Tax=Paraclostridium bifermentans TaxID=1490 RepID=UPI0034DF834F
MFNKKKRKQKISIATFFIVLLNIIFTSVTQMGVAYAEGTPFKLNSDVVMKVNGNPVNLGSVVELAPGNKVDFEVTYSADNEAPVPQEGDEFKFVLPSVFKDIKPVYPENHFKDMTIEEQNGETVVTLICGPDIDTAIGGFLKIGATVSQVEVEVPGKIIIEINGKEIVIDTETNPPGSNDKLIDKKVNGQDNDYTINPGSNGDVVGQEVPYSVMVNEKYTHMENAVFTDDIPEGMELVDGSVKVEKIVNGASQVIKDYEIKSTNPLVINLNTINHKHKISYKLKVTEFKNEYLNRAIITSSTTGSESDSVKAIPKEDAKGDSHINKTIIRPGSSIRPNEQGSFIGQNVEYRVEVNSVKESKENVVFTDNIPDGMNLVKNSVRVFKEVRGQNINVTSEFSNKITQQDNLLKIAFGDINNKYIVEYKTVIVEYRDEYKNDATINYDGGENSSSTVTKPIKPTKPGLDSINKTINGQKEVSIEPSEDKEQGFIGKQLKYSILVNDELKQKNKLVLKDSIPEGMKILENTIKVYIDNGYNSFSEVNSSKVPRYVKVIEGKEVLVVDFGDTNKRYKIEYKTKITELKDRYENTAKVTWDGGSDNSTAIAKPMKPTPGTDDLNKKVNGNSSITVSYDKNFIGKTLDYEIIVNDKMQQKDNAVLKDSIPKGMELVDKSIRVLKDYGSGVYKDVTSDLKIESDKSSFTINLGNITDRYKITYKTKITELVETGYKNTAVLTHSKDQSEESSAVVNIKAGSIDPGENERVVIKGSDKNTISKVGDKVKYHVDINPNNKRIFDLVFEDTIPTGMKLIKDGFKVTETDNSGKVMNRTQEFLDNWDKICGKDESGKNDKLTINFGDTYSKYRIEYMCEITALKKSYENTAKVTGRDIDRVSKDEVNYAVSAGGINATKYANKTELKDGDSQIVDYTIKVWSNAVFPAEYLNIVDKLDSRVEYKGCEAPEFMKVDYDKNSHTVKIVNIDDIPTSSKDKPVEVKLKVDFTNVPVGETVKNIAKINDKETPPAIVKKGYKFEAVKVDGDNNNAPLKDVEFDLYKVEQSKLFNLIPYGSKDLVHIKKLVSDEKGLISSQLKDAGNYVLREIKAPDGYNKLEKDVEFEVKDESIGSVVKLPYIVNNKYYEFGAQKIDSETGKGLQGAEFRLEDEKGKVIIEKLTSGDDGKLYGRVNEAGKYYLVETKAPDGYMLSPKKVELNIEKGKFEIVDLGNIENKVDPESYKFEGKKVDSENGNALQGAEFRLEDAKGKVVIEKLVSDKDGKIYGAVEREGKYYLVETKAPDGYMLSPKKVELNIEKGKFEIVDLGNIENKVDPEAYKFEGKKVDSENGNALQGAEFRLEDEKGKVVIEKLVSDKDGKIYGAVEREGKYYLVETKAPDGYMLSPKKVELNIEKGKFEIVDLGNIENKVDPEAYKFEGKKVDSENGNALQGAEFRLEDEKGKVVIEKLVSDKDGKIYGAVEREGKYYLVETKAPDGYMLSPKKVELNIEKGKFEIVDLGNIENEKVKTTPKPDPEKPKPVDPEKPSIDKPSTSKPNKPSINPGVTSPATGDASILTYSLLGVGATGLMIGINRKKKK